MSILSKSFIAASCCAKFSNNEKDYDTLIFQAWGRTFYACPSYTTVSVNRNTGTVHLFVKCWCQTYCIQKCLSSICEYFSCHHFRLDKYGKFLSSENITVSFISARHKCITNLQVTEYDKKESFENQCYSLCCLEFCYFWPYARLLFEKLISFLSFIFSAGVGYMANIHSLKILIRAF